MRTKKMYQVRFQILLSALILVALMSCKPPGTGSNLNTLENLAAGKTINWNECQNPSLPDSKVQEILSTDFIEGGDSQTRTAAAKAYLMIPDELKRIFADKLRGKIVLTKDTKELCAASDDAAACYTSFNRNGMAIVLKDEKKLVAHHLVRQFGYILSQVLPKMDEVQASHVVILNQEDRDDFAAIKVNLASAYLADLAYYNLFMPSEIASIGINVKSKAISDADGGQQIGDFVLAETFDSYHCSPNGAYDDLVAKGIKAQTIAVKHMNLLKNSRKLLSGFFPRTCAQYTKYFSKIFPNDVAENCLASSGRGLALDDGDTSEQSTQDIFSRLPTARTPDATSAMIDSHFGSGAKSPSVGSAPQVDMQSIIANQDTVRRNFAGRPVYSQVPSNLSDAEFRNSNFAAGDRMQAQKVFGKMGAISAGMAGGMKDSGVDAVKGIVSLPGNAAQMVMHPITSGRNAMEGVSNSIGSAKQNYVAGRDETDSVLGGVWNATPILNTAVSVMPEMTKPDGTQYASEAEMYRSNGHALGDLTMLVAGGSATKATMGAVGAAAQTTEIGATAVKYGSQAAAAAKRFPGQAMQNAGDLVSGGVQGGKQMLRQGVDRFKTRGLPGELSGEGNFLKVDATSQFVDIPGAPSLKVVNRDATGVTLETTYGNLGKTQSAKHLDPKTLERYSNMDQATYTRMQQSGVPNDAVGIGPNGPYLNDQHHRTTAYAEAAQKRLGLENIDDVPIRIRKDFDSRSGEIRVAPKDPLDLQGTQGWLGRTDIPEGRFDRLQNDRRAFDEAKRAETRDPFREALIRQLMEE